MERGTILGDRFRLAEPIGEGGMGVVWRAFDLKLEGDVAVKVVSTDRLGPETMVRFAREAKAAAALRSSHVVQVIDHGEEDDFAYIAMELLEGESLRMRLDRGAISPEVLLNVLEPIARVLDRAHDKGIIHRDLKPGNIQLVTEGDSVRPVLLDFGIAKVIGVLDEETRTGALMGTPYYMSPEQLMDSKHVDRNADLWAMAIIAYEALVAVRPFRGDTVGELVAKLLRDAPPIPSQHGDVPGAFDAWFARATSMDVEARFDDATKMIGELRRAMVPTDDVDALLETETVAATDENAELRVAVRTATGGRAQRGSLVTRSEPPPPLAEAATVDASTTGEDSKKGDGNGVVWFLASAVVAVGLYVATQYKDDADRSVNGVASAATAVVSSSTTSKSSTGGVTTATTSAKPRRWSAVPCNSIEALEAPPTCKRETYVAWCDRAHKRVACCGEGLAPMAADGTCVCPPGGSTNTEAQDSGCDPPTPFDKKAFSTVVRAFTPDLRACYEAALARNEKLKGKVTFDIVLDARGHVFRAGIRDSSFPDGGAQRCFVDIWAQARFVPPPNGSLVLGYPVVFVSD